MKKSEHGGRTWLVAIAVLSCLPVISVMARVQDPRDVARELVATSDLRGPFPVSPVVGVPFTAEGILVVTQTKAGVRSQRTAETRFYRDSKGRSR
jgi:hypothetical protein